MLILFFISCLKFWPMGGDLIIIIKGVSRNANKQNWTNKQSRLLLFCELFAGMGIETF